MALDAGDIVDNLLDEQARRNAANPNQGATDDLVTDFQTIYPPELIGMGNEVVTAVPYAFPHTWGDGHSVWGFVRWGPAIPPKLRWGDGRPWGDGSLWGN